MEPAVLAPHHLPHHEPISFGIDQILSGPEPPGGGLGPGQVGQSQGESAAFSSGFHGTSGYAPAGSLASLPRGSGVGPGGVIRVPAHRPVPVPPPSGAAPAVAGPSGLGGPGGLAGLTFPWMDSGRRFAKDRLTGEIAQLLGVLPPATPFLRLSAFCSNPITRFISPLCSSPWTLPDPIFLSPQGRGNKRYCRQVHTLRLCCPILPTARRGRVKFGRTRFFLSRFMNEASVVGGDPLLTTRSSLLSFTSDHPQTLPCSSVP